MFRNDSDTSPVDENVNDAFGIPNVDFHRATEVFSDRDAVPTGAEIRLGDIHLQLDEPEHTRRDENIGQPNLNFTFDTPDTSSRHSGEASIGNVDTNASPQELPVVAERLTPDNSPRDEDVNQAVNQAFGVSGREIHKAAEVFLKEDSVAAEAYVREGDVPLSLDDPEHTKRTEQIMQPNRLHRAGYSDSARKSAEVSTRRVGTMFTPLEILVGAEDITPSPALNSHAPEPEENAATHGDIDFEYLESLNPMRLFEEPSAPEEQPQANNANADEIDPMDLQALNPSPFFRHLIYQHQQNNLEYQGQESIALHTDGNAIEFEAVNDAIDDSIRVGYNTPLNPSALFKQPDDENMAPAHVEELNPVALVQQPKNAEQEVQESILQGESNAMNTDSLNAGPAPGSSAQNNVASPSQLHIVPASRRTCQVCSITFDKKKIMWKHRAELHPQQKPYTCMYCGLTSNRRREVINHLTRTHPDVQLFSCNVCRSRFQTEAGHDLHIQERHVLKQPYECGDCTRRYKSLGNLTCHQREHKHGKYSSA